jgi:hypothetical protein
MFFFMVFMVVRGKSTTLDEKVDVIRGMTATNAWLT